MRVCVERRSADLPQQLAERRPAGEVGPQDERVDEEPDQALDLGAVPVSGERPDDYVLFARVAAKQRLEPGQQHHEERGSLLAAQRLERGGHRAGNRDVVDRAAPGGDRRARPVRWQLDHRQVGQLPLPVRNELCEDGPGQPVALPHGEVCILQRELGQRRRLPGGEAVPNRRQLVPEDVERPCVRDNVVHHDKEHVVLVVNAHEKRSQQRSRREVEWLLARRSEQPLRLVLALGVPAANADLPTAVRSKGAGGSPTPARRSPP